MSPIKGRNTLSRHLPVSYVPSKHRLMLQDGHFARRDRQEQRLCHTKHDKSPIIKNFSKSSIEK